MVIELITLQEIDPKRFVNALYCLVLYTKYTFKLLFCLSNHHVVKFNVSVFSLSYFVSIFICSVKMHFVLLIKYVVL